MEVVVGNADFMEAEFGERFEPEFGVFVGDSPVGICNDAGFETHVTGEADGFDHRGIVERGFAAFEVNDFDVAEADEFGEDFADFGDGESAFGSGTGVDEAVVAFEIAGVCEEEMQAGEHRESSA